MTIYILTKDNYRNGEMTAHRQVEEVYGSLESAYAALEKEWHKADEYFKDDKDISVLWYGTHDLVIEIENGDNISQEHYHVIEREVMN